MIEITFYKNGFDVNGHANVQTCAEVSLLTWCHTNLITSLDETALYYSSNLFGDHSGRTCLEFDPSNERAMWVHNHCKQNARIWGDEFWKKSDVQIKEVDEQFKYPYSKEVSEKTFL